MVLLVCVNGHVEGIGGDHATAWPGGGRVSLDLTETLDVALKGELDREAASFAAGLVLESLGLAGSRLDVDALLSSLAVCDLPEACMFCWG